MRNKNIQPRGKTKFFGHRREYCRYFEPPSSCSKLRCGTDSGRVRLTRRVRFAKRFQEKPIEWSITRLHTTVRDSNYNAAKLSESDLNIVEVNCGIQTDWTHLRLKRVLST